jgi:hypothetical protein
MIGWDPVDNSDPMQKINRDTGMDIKELIQDYAQDKKARIERRNDTFEERVVKMTTAMTQ